MMHIYEVRLVDPLETISRHQLLGSAQVFGDQKALLVVQDNLGIGAGGLAADDMSRVDQMISIIYRQRNFTGRPRSHKAVLRKVLKKDLLIKQHCIPVDDFIYSRLQFGGNNGFKQIVQRTYLKGPDRKFAVSGRQI